MRSVTTRHSSVARSPGGNLPSEFCGHPISRASCNARRTFRGALEKEASRLTARLGREQACRCFQPLILSPRGFYEALFRWCFDCCRLHACVHLRPSRSPIELRWKVYWRLATQRQRQPGDFEAGRAGSVQRTPRLRAGNVDLFGQRPDVHEQPRHVELHART